MQRVRISGVVIIGMLCAASPSAFAAQQSAVSGEHKATPASPPAASTPALPSTPAAPKPVAVSMSVEGMLTALDLQASPPTLTVQISNDRTWKGTLRPGTTAIWKSGKRLPADQLQTGQRVKVRYIKTSGGAVAQSLSVLPAVVPASPAASSTKGGAY